MEIFREEPPCTWWWWTDDKLHDLCSPRSLKRETPFLPPWATCLCGRLKLGLGYGVLAQGRECTINSKHRIFAGNYLPPQIRICGENSSLSMPRRKNPKERNSPEERKLNGSTQVRRGEGHWLGSDLGHPLPFLVGLQCGADWLSIWATDTNELH